MPDQTDINALLKEAEIYRAHGLLAESKETYSRALKLIKKDEQASKNVDLIDAVNLKIRTVEDELAVLDKDVDKPDLSKEMQDLIGKLFSFSENKNMASIESAVALAKFGQYEKAISEFDRLIKDGFQVDSQCEVEEVTDQFKSLLRELSNSYKDLRDQSVQLFRYTKELLQYYERVKEEEELRAQLSRYVGQNLVERLLKSKEAVLFENEKKEVTVLFADIRSFTSMSERMSAEEVVSMLNQFFTAMVDIIFKHNGILDKFVGDQIMAVYGVVTTDNTTQYDNSIHSAIEMQKTTEKIMKIRRQLGKQTFEIGVGINTGIAIVGNLGSANRMDYTVIGDCVNVAARLQQMAKGGEIIIGEETYRLSGGDFHTEEKGEISVKNRNKPVRCYEVLR